LAITSMVGEWTGCMISGQVEPSNSTDVVLLIGNRQILPNDRQSTERRRWQGIDTHAGSPL
jgi:hypothetical protein